MQIGVDSFGAVISDPATRLNVSAVQRMDNLLDEITLADKVGLDVFGIGEHHRSEVVESSLRRRFCFLQVMIGDRSATPSYGVSSRRCRNSMQGRFE